jgi:hypothetical protein
MVYRDYFNYVTFDKNEIDDYYIINIMLKNKKYN